ncbi:MAG: hypothetical protein OXQ89_06830 [Rhodospirillaceae bacterium]|nr:hypothetical protein [Rhodospirillaceae bacterium]
MVSFAADMTGLRDVAGRYRMPLTAAAAAFGIVLAAALAIPVTLPHAGSSGGRDAAMGALPDGALQAEDLSAFLTSSRWGVVLQDIIDEEAAAAAAAAQAALAIEMTRELAEIGFVGLMVESREYAVLLVMPDGKIARLAGGDTLPDGRTLVSVTGNSLTLEGSEGQQDVLPLFPRLRTE